jgi:hypothetical protein
MSEMKPHKGICYEGVPKVIRSYISNAAAAAITQASTTAVTYIVDQYDDYDDAIDDNNATSIQTEVTAGSVSSLIYDTAQSWDEHDTGYNFQMTLPAASFPTKGKWYAVEVWVDPASGEDFIGGQWFFECQATRKD